ncbi:cytochrome P450 family protein [Streptomyces sp. 4F14]|uniref:cytochrome P450 family protein n=1 Tax=Streptomyces sp. 4F14 TaxID=3394380 RepID=UPI003A88B10B
MTVTSLHQHPRPIPVDPRGADLPAQAARLRAAGDVVAVELLGGVRAWMPTTQRVMEPLLTDPRVSRDARRHWDAWGNGWLAGHPEAHWMYGLISDSMLSSYGPEHTRLRKLVAPAFTGRRIKALQPAFDRIAAGLLDPLARVAPGEVTDLRAVFADPLPLRVICEMFDVRGEGAVAVKEFATILLNDPAALGSSDAPEVCRAAFAEVLADKRVHPGDDLTTALVQAQDGDDTLTDTEIVDTMVLVLGAGLETTVHLIGNAIVALLQHPEQLAEVRAGRVPWEAVVEETLRFAAAAPMSPLRFAVEDITVGDVRIRAGEAIIAAFGLYGWDPARHGEDAGRFDIGRPAPARHLAFGHGVHHCLGAPLARAEALTALPALFERFPRVSLAGSGSPDRVPSFLIHGFREIEVVLDHGEPDRQ